MINQDRIALSYVCAISLTEKEIDKLKKHPFFNRKKIRHLSELIEKYKFCLENSLKGIDKSKDL